MVSERSISSPTTGRSVLSAAAAALALFAGWALVRVTIKHGAGVKEAQFLANQAVAVLAFLIPVLLLKNRLQLIGSQGHLRVFPYALVAPFLALAFLPPALRSLSSLTTVLAATTGFASLWLGARGSLHSALPLGPATTKDWKRHDWLLDFCILCAGVSAALLVKPVPLPLFLPLGEAPFGSLSPFAVAVVNGALFGAGVIALRSVWGSRALLAGGAVILFAGVHPFAGLSMLALFSIELALTNRTQHRRLLFAVAAGLVIMVSALSLAGLLLPMVAWAQRQRRGWFAALIVLGGLLALALPSRGWGWIALGLATLVLAFPFFTASCLQGGTAGLRKLRIESDGVWRLLTGAAVAVVALRTQDPGLAMVPAVLLFAAPMPRRKGLDAGSSPEAQQGVGFSTASKELGLRDLDGDATFAVTMQAGWILGWIAAVAAVASYPWFRPSNLMHQIGFDQGIHAPGQHEALLIGICGLAALVGTFVLLRQPTARRQQLAAPLVPSMLLLTVLFGLYQVEPRPITTLHQWPPVVLTAESPEASFLLSESTDVSIGSETVSVWIDSSLANSNLPPDTRVATVWIGSAEQRGDNSATVFSGTDTDEWRLGEGAAASIRPFSVWWTDDEPPILGRRFRTKLELPASHSASGALQSLHVRLDPSLDQAVQFRIDRVAVSSSVLRGRKVSGSLSAVSRNAKAPKP